jgi:predicted DNA-binding transcriptional regulator YafY
MYERLNKGEMLYKEVLANNYGVSYKTVQRDIDDLRTYLTETHYSEQDDVIKYDKSKNGYFLVRVERELLTNEEVMAICKILLESRAFCKAELNGMIGKLLAQVAPNDRKKVENMIKSEQYHYVPLRHNKPLLQFLWDLSQYIQQNEVILFQYTRQDGGEKERAVKPLAIMFSEYYFYLVAFIEDATKEIPITFRIDRIQQLKPTGRHYRVPYKDKFSEGEFRKRIQFMYSGELKRVKFEYSGPSIEAVLDRLPTAEIIHYEAGVYTIRAEAYGKGIDMWLRSQGEYVKIL